MVATVSLLSPSLASTGESGSVVVVAGSVEVVVVSGTVVDVVVGASVVVVTASSPPLQEAATRASATTTRTGLPMCVMDFSSPRDRAITETYSPIGGDGADFRRVRTRRTIPWEVSPGKLTDMPEAISKISDQSNGSAKDPVVRGRATRPRTGSRLTGTSTRTPASRKARET